MRLSLKFAGRMGQVFGAAGEEWARGFPRIYDECVAKWALSSVEPIADLSINFVAKARLPNGNHVVLKAGVPNREFTSEVEALRIFDGRGYVRVLDYSTDLNAMILESIDPGTPLADIGDDAEATNIAASLLNETRSKPPVNHTLPSVVKWAAGLSKLRPHFGGGTGPFPYEYVELAETLFGELLAGCEQDILIHGDFHHWNILRSGRASWVIIDPKGLVGPQGYEIGQFIHNFPSEPESTYAMGTLISNRVDIFSSMLDIPREQLLKWAFAQTILSAWWCVEDGGDCRPTLECAGAIRAYL